MKPQNSKNISLHLIYACDFEASIYSNESPTNYFSLDLKNQHENVKMEFMFFVCNSKKNSSFTPNSEISLLPLLTGPMTGGFREMIICSCNIEM